jgi:hypothetical protein
MLAVRCHCTRQNLSSGRATGISVRLDGGKAIPFQPPSPLGQHSSPCTHVSLFSLSPSRPFSWPISTLAPSSKPISIPSGVLITEPITNGTASGACRQCGHPGWLRASPYFVRTTRFKAPLHRCIRNNVMRGPFTSTRRALEPTGHRSPGS